MYIDGSILVLLFLLVGIISFQYGKKSGRHGYRKLTDRELAKRDAEWAELKNQGIYQMHDEGKDK